MNLLLCLVGYEDLRLINAKGVTEYAAEEANRWRLKRDVYILLSINLRSYERAKVLETTDLEFDVKRLQRKKVLMISLYWFQSNFLVLDDIDLSIQREQQLEEDEVEHGDAYFALRSLFSEDCKVDDGNFLLPDLNLMPCEENGDHYASSLGVETTLYGIRMIRSEEESHSTLTSGFENRV
ncbi:unnamed protein product [Microthlaspi erraticum]|uniref:Uncharacterized protein n=1 Tax=Microthlaspi erraticum TaxID=1685480 RepID=A0A6D2IN28_9BRAS|nr:unnamed protein product [Microthlaspi erraticum]